MLSTGGIPTSVHGAMHKFLPIYEAEGYAFPGVEAYHAKVDRHRALVVVPGMRDYLEAKRDVRVAYVSGWAALANARTRSTAQELIPYSDHADFSARDHVQYAIEHAETGAQNRHKRDFLAADLLNFYRPIPALNGDRFQRKIGAGFIG